MAANQGLGLSCIKNPTCLTINNKQCTESSCGIKLYFNYIISPEICVKLLFETQTVYIKNVFFHNRMGKFACMTNVRNFRKS